MDEARDAQVGCGRASGAGEAMREDRRGGGQRCKRKRLEGERRGPWDGGTEEGEEAAGEGGGESGRRRSWGPRRSGPWKGRPAGRPRINDYGWDPASWFATFQVSLSSRTAF